MAYTAGDTILDDEYNTFATGNADGSGSNGTQNLNTLWGTGTGDYGYGETGSVIAAVSAGATITATQWETLVGRMETIAAHQGTSVTAVATITAGDTIDAITTLSNDINTLWTNRMNAAASGTAITTGGTSTRTAQWAGTGGPQTVNTTQRVAFASAAAARYFFNTGGEIHITMDQPTATTTQSQNWDAIFDTSIGTIKMGYTGTTRTGSGGTPSTTTGFYDLSGSYATIFEGTNIGSGAYSANDVLVQAKVSGAVVTFQITLDDQHTPTAPSAVDTVESGTKADFTVRKSSVYTIATPGFATTESF